MKPQIYPYITVCILVLSLRAQQVDLEPFLEGELESDEQAELVEQLQDILESPLDLNHVSADELRVLPWVTPQMAREIIGHRRRNRKFRSVEELLALPSIDKETFEILRHFLAVDWKQALTFHSRQRIQRPVRLPVGFGDGNYRGSPEKVYNRIKINWQDRVSLRLVSEKDPGEQRLADHYAGSAVWRAERLSTQFVLGNFSYERGHGLMSWGGFRFTSGGTDPIQPYLQSARGLVPYATSSEMGTPAGFGFSSRFGGAKLVGFYGTILHDASTKGDSVSSIITSGYHRTFEEKSKSNTLTERIGGVDFYFENKIGEFAVGMLGNQFSRPFVANPYDVNQNLTFALYYSRTVNNLIFSGESAANRSGAISSYGQGLLSWPALDLVVAAWRYSPEFANRHAFSIGQNRHGRNELGAALGTKARIKETISLSLLSTFYRSLQPTQLAFPSSGSRHTFVFTWRPQRRLRLLARLVMRKRYSLEKSADQFDNRVKKLALGRALGLRLQLEYQLAKAISIKTRYESKSFSTQSFGFQLADQVDTTGTLIYHQLSWKKRRFGVVGRWCLFDAPSYDVRFYVYENDAPGVMRLKSLQYRGSRFFLLLWCRYKFSTTFIKIERTIYDNRDTIGSGDDLIPSSETGAVAIQFELRF